MVPNEGRIILDGEMLVYDPVTDRNLPFGTLKTAALGKPIITFDYPLSPLNVNLSSRQEENRSKS